MTQGSMSTQPKVEHGATLEEVLRTPPAFWVDPNGGGTEDPTADRLSWEVELRKGLADRLKGLVDVQRQMCDRLRQMVRLARSRGDAAVLLEHEKRLAGVEPLLARNEETLNFCAAWVGHGPKHLEARLREAEAAASAVEQEASDYRHARGIVLAAGVDEKALATSDRSMAAKVGAAAHAVEVARKIRDQNLEATAAAQASLERMR